MNFRIHFILSAIFLPTKQQTVTPNDTMDNSTEYTEEPFDELEPPLELPNIGIVDIVPEENEEEYCMNILVDCLFASKMYL